MVDGDTCSVRLALKVVLVVSFHNFKTIEFSKVGDTFE